MRMHKGVVTGLVGLLALLVLLLAGRGVIAGPLAQEPDPEGLPTSNAGVSVATTVPTAIRYQGRLWDDVAQEWVTGQRDLTFSIYDEASAGQQLWTETKTGVPVLNGLFRVALDVEPSLFNGQAVWLEVQVGGDPEPLSPRTALLPVPYALGLVPGASLQGETATAMLRVMNDGSSVGLLDVASHGVHATSVFTGTAGVYGSTAFGYGVEGSSWGNIGVFGHSGQWFESPPRPAGQHGVLGLSTSDHAVVGRTQSDEPLKAGVLGESTTGEAEGVRGQGFTGVHGIGSSVGVRGESDGVGVHGAGKTAGVVGQGTSTGVEGEGVSGTGVYGLSRSNDANVALGVHGRADVGTGVKGEGFVGVHGVGNSAGVLGEGASGGVRGTGTSYGVEGESDGVGVHGISHGDRVADAGVLGEATSRAGVRGESVDGYGGSFHSTESFGVLAVSGNTGAPTVFPAGQHGIVGMGDSDPGSYGGYFTGDSGIYAAEEEDTGEDFAGYFQGDVKITDRLRVEGILTVDGLATFNGGKSGFVVDVCQNDDAQPLESGDVVVVSGVAPAVIGDIPVIKVRRAVRSSDSAVVGVVDRRFVPGDGEDGEPTYEQGEIAVGEYLTMVILGAFQRIKVDTSAGAIRPGDLLVPSATSGHAMRAAEPAPGTIIGKALGTLESGTGTVPVLVTLQ